MNEIIYLLALNDKDFFVQSSIGIFPLVIVSNGYSVVVRITLIKLFEKKTI
jgi:hypothetical protein